MKVFLAGATGAIGRPLVRELVAAGHEVSALTRSPERATALEAAGAKPAVADVFDANALREAVRGATPDAVINELTDLPADLDPKHLADYYARNDRIRVEGSANLLAAAAEAGAQRYVAQSVAFWYAPVGDGIKDEDAPLWKDAPGPFGTSVAAVEAMEQKIRAAQGIDAVILRYGFLYGQGTWYAPDGQMGRMTRKRQNPILGRGEGVSSFIHVEDAARATVAALERAQAGTYNVVDDVPAAQKEWLPGFAKALGAPTPLTTPAWLAEVVVGKPLVVWQTTLRGASNAHFKAATGWTPKYPSWQEGFAALGSSSSTA
jgi:nucleoside-diphosphate-sugar epimerase